MKTRALLILTALVVAMPAIAQESPQRSERHDYSVQKGGSSGSDLANALRSMFRRRGSLGVTLADYIACVKECNTTFPNEPAKSTCIEGCRSIESKLEISIQ